MSNKKVAIAYIPVLHKGYLSFVDSFKEKGVKALYVISDDILESHEELDYINRKDRLRALPYKKVCSFLSIYTTLPVHSLTIETVLALQKEQVTFYMPREDINLFIAETYFGGHSIEYSDVFLRWNRENVGEAHVPKCKEETLSDFEKSVVRVAMREAGKSTDWWRQVGAVLVKNGEVISFAHNEHMPEKELPNIIGDTRSLYKKGINVEYVTAAHAEVGTIGEAAQKGISTEGAELFVTDFPCPYCARLIAKAGIKKIYYQKGYAVLGGDEFFKDMGIEVMKVSEE